MSRDDFTEIARHSTKAVGVTSIVSQISDNIDELFAEFLGDDAHTSGATATTESLNSSKLAMTNDGKKTAGSVVYGDEKTRTAVSELKRPTSMSNVSTKLEPATKRKSVLERSRGQWDEYKQKAGDDLGVELDNANRGRAGFVDKMEFLARADYRQFEHERDVRAVARRTQQPPPPPL
jgi:hypothetical protein